MIEQIISRRLQIPLHQVQGTVCLLREGATIPFISRYRKEARKQTVLTTIEGQGRLTPELRRRIAECWDAVELEDIYLPYKPKRRTRATVARERGLEPLAEIILAQQSRNVVQQARRFVSAEVPTPEEALAGACDIVAERISEDERARAARSPAKASSIRNSSKAKRRKGRNTPTISTPRRPCAASRRTASWPCAAARRRAS